MEKFGIFDLLDALSAFASAGKEAEGNKKQDLNSAAFAPPSYGAGQSGGQETAPEAPSAPKQGEALSAFLNRHDSLSKKIDDNR